MHDRLIDEPVSVEVEVLESGPLRGRLRIRRTYCWPTDLDSNADRRGIDLVDVVVDMVVELRSHEDFVRMNVEFVNPSRSHRVRLHVPLGEHVTGSESEGQFAVTARGRESEGGWGEYPLPTYPADSFVSAGPVTVLLEHASEYEVVESAGSRESELAITLLRAVGSISVNVHPLREEPAYAEVPIPGAQEIGSTVAVRAAILPSRAGWRAAGAVERASLFRSDVLISRGAAVGSAARKFTPGFEVSGRDVQVSSLRRVSDGVELRLVALSPSPACARVTGPFRSASPIDLLGNPGAAIDATSGLEVELNPWEISSWLLQS
jgi:alpha-mannosidase